MTSVHERGTPQRETRVIIDFSKASDANMPKVIRALYEFNKESGITLCAEVQRGKGFLFPTPSFRTIVKGEDGSDVKIAQFLLVTPIGYFLIESEDMGTKGNANHEVNAHNIHALIEKARIGESPCCFEDGSLFFRKININMDGTKSNSGNDKRLLSTRLAEVEDPTKIIEIFKLNMQRVKDIASASEGIMSGITPQPIK